MGHALDAYSIQQWLESCPQGYLVDTVWGHGAEDVESEAIMENTALHEEAVRTTVQLVLGERCALSASAGLIGCAPDEASRRFLATQVLDEARHVEIFTQRLYDLGIARNKLEDTIAQLANPHLVEFAGVLLEKIDKKDFVAGVVGQNLILEGMAFTVFEMLHAFNANMNPKFSNTLSGTIADERRHVGFGENCIGSLIKRHPERKADVERLQKEMSYHMLATFAEAFERGQRALTEAARLTEEQADEAPAEPATWQGTPLITASSDELEALLGDTVLKEFKVRLGRVGIDYQTPVRP